MIAMRFFSKFVSGSNLGPAPPALKKQGAPRNVGVKASVHPEMSSAKMMRLKKAELINACEEYGVGTSGTKHELVAELRQHFSASKTIADPGAASVDEVDDGMDLVQQLTSKVSQLDEAIQTKTNELQSMHEGDRVLMAEVVNELAELKVAWERKLSDVSAGLEEVVALRQAQTEFSKLQQQQMELREELEVLSRMLKLRESETQTLQAQLEQVKQEQSIEKESLQTERLAVLALASQVAGGPPTQAWANPPQGGVWTTPKHTADEGGSDGLVDAPSIRKMLAVSPDLVSLTEVKPAGGSDVLGAALPGLLLINGASEILRKYSSVRDSVFTTVLQARMSDAAFAGSIVMLTAALF